MHRRANSRPKKFACWSARSRSLYHVRVFPLWTRPLLAGRAFLFTGWGAFLCFGPLFMAASTARSNRSHALASPIGTFVAMTTPKEKRSPIGLRPLEEPFRDFWLHLGKFLFYFAQIEQQVIDMLVELSGLSSTEAGVVFHGTRQESARDLINRLLDAKGQYERKERLREPFSQIGAIGTVRNNLVHWGAEMTGDGVFSVSNAHRKPLKPKEFEITVIDFEDMLSDMLKISVLISFETTRPWVAVKPGGLDALLEQPWQYKPPQPSLPQKTPNLDRTISQRQPRASRGSRKTRNHE